MAELTYREAVARGIAQEMARDPDVVFLGEDVGKAGGVFKATVGLLEQFGPLRVRDTPISEQAILGAAMGAAMTGLKPIAEIMFSDFFAVCFDYIANEFAKSRYMSNGQVKCPLVVRTGNGAGSRFGAQHSQSVENWCMMIPGLKVVAPSNPRDVIGLLAAAVRDPDPVIFFEHKSLYATKGEVPDGEIVDTLGTAKILRPRKDATILALALMVPRALEAADKLKAEHGIDAEVVDVRSLVPLDTQTIMASVASASVDDAKAAIDAAHDAFAGWAARKPRERAEILRKAFELIVRDAERFAKLITIENGKALSDSKGEVLYSAEFFRWNAEEAVRNIGQVYMAPASGARVVAQHKPAGVAVLVTPWNFPAAMATRKIGPALAAGCTVVLKPASDTPLTMLALMPVLEEAGVPPGVVNVSPSRQSGKVVSAMLHDPRVRVVSFTGSTEVGRKLLHEAADNIVKPAMELGGNAPFIVFEDADIDSAIDGAMIAKMRNIGEACTAANRFYVQEKIHDEFAKKLSERMGALKMGNGLEDGVAVGPLVNADTRDKVVNLVADELGTAANVLLGGKPANGKGFFYPATVITKVPDDAQLLREEIFGPVAAILTFKSEDDVVERANDTE